MISPIFTTIVISFLIILIYLKRTTNTFNIGEKALHDKEIQANNTRKQSLAELSYINIPLDKLPFNAVNDNPEIENIEAAIKDISNKKIVNFTGITNTDLKLTYGVANLPILTEYDQNFTALVSSLNTWGNLLLANKLTADAKCVLEYAVDIGSDIKSTYDNLADIYVANFEFDKIDILTEKANNLNSLMKNPIINSLNEKSDINKFVSSNESN